MQCELCGLFFDGFHNRYFVIKKSDKKLKVCESCSKLDPSEIKSLNRAFIKKRGNRLYNLL
jgi:ribosome-binding protein aMBF1 (putative translation factor)